MEKLLKSLLGRTFIAADLPAATAQIQNGHAGCDFVTLKGDLLSRHGIYTGGYLNGHGNPKAPGSILGRKNQIADLQNELTAIQDRVAEMSRKRGVLLGEQTELQASLQQAQTELREQEVAIATREGEFNALQNSNRLLHQKIETVVFEIQSLAAQEQEGLQKRERADGAIGRTGSARTRRPGKSRRAHGGTGKSPAAARRRQHRAHREQGRARGRGAAFGVVPAAAAGAGAAHPRIDAGAGAAAWRDFLVCRPQGAGGIRNSGIALAD